VIVVVSWVYVGARYATEGERWLALSAAARVLVNTVASPERN
jgi:hypothetical protein